MGRRDNPDEYAGILLRQFRHDLRVGVNKGTTGRVFRGCFPFINMRNFIVKVLSTFFYIGYLPFMPGTYGSMAGLFLFFLIKDNILLHILFVLLSMLLGFLVSGRAEKIFNQKDAKCIVIDEVSGMLLTLLFIPYELKLVIIAFVLFRILDGLKPYPADKLQNLRGSMGVMSDDIIAGLYANIVLQVVLRLASFKAS